MTREEAIQLALGYAWASEDVSHRLTAGDPNQTTALQFAKAFAAGWDDYNAQARCDMIPVRRAYERWQESGGRTIFPKGDSTAEQQARHAEMRKRWREENGKPK